jgi:hypothetical protein
MTDEAGYLLVISSFSADASTTLYFGNAIERGAPPMRIAQMGDPALPALMAGAAALILVRGLVEFEVIVRCAQALSVPLYYFIDDNFMLLQRAGVALGPDRPDYSVDNVRRILGGVCGVLASSPALVRFFSDAGLHQSVDYYPPIHNPPGQRPQCPGHSSLRIAFLGGRHLHGMLAGLLVPAAQRLARRRPVTLVTLGVGDEPMPPGALQVERHDYEPSYRRAVERLAERGVDVLAHPVAPDLDNNIFKTPHALITADGLGAVPAVSNRTPYGEIGALGIATCCDDTIDAWCEGLGAAADGRDSIRPRLNAYCERRFGGADNLRVLAGFAERHVPPDPVQHARRTARVRRLLFADRVRRRLKRVATILR